MRLRLGIVTFVALTVASLAPIRSNDYFWHLATGRWIWEHHALPLTDPFGVASSRAPWINGEWLFEVLLYPLFRLGGHAAVGWGLAIATAALFCAMFLRMTPAAGEGSGATLLLIIICWYGAEAWLRERPSAAGAACLAVVIVLCSRPLTRWTLGALFLTVVVWANVHPSALIAPVVVALLAWRAAPVAAVALVVNPWGVQGLLNPLHLVNVVKDFHNEEWAPSTPGEFPLFYAIVVVALLLFVMRRHREDLGRFLVFVLLTALAIRFCRNQGLFFVALPLLIARSIPPVTAKVQRILLIASAAVMIAVLTGAWFRTGVDESKFPLSAVARLRESGLPGRIYNGYGTGGFLIWTFYGERRVITDGRNELYVAYNVEHNRALADVGEWHRFVHKWDLRLAVFDPRGITVRLPDGRSVPSALVYFPPREWALIAIDPAAMVFARRDAYPAALLARWAITPRAGDGARSARPPASTPQSPRTPQ